MCWSSLVFAIVGDASAASINKCVAAKNKCVAKKAAGLLNCHAKAETKGTAVDPSCITKAQEKFDGGPLPAKGCFEKLEAKPGCLTFDDTATLENVVDAFVLDVVQQIDPGYPVPVQNKCSTAKKKCVSKYQAAFLGCHQKSNKTGSLDSGCMTKAQTKFVDCFTKSEAKPPCLVNGDVANLQATADAHVQDVVCELDPLATGCGGGSCPGALAVTVNAERSGHLSR